MAQTVRLNRNFDHGYLVLLLDGVASGHIAAGASTSDIKTALADIAAIGSTSNVAVTGTDWSAGVVIDTDGDLAGETFDAFVADTSNCSASPIVDTTVQVGVIGSSPNLWQLIFPDPSVGPYTGTYSINGNSITGFTDITTAISDIDSLLTSTYGAGIYTVSDASGGAVDIAADTLALPLTMVSSLIDLSSNPAPFRGVLFMPGDPSTPAVHSLILGASGGTATAPSVGTSSSRAEVLGNYASLTGKTVSLVVGKGSYADPWMIVFRGDQGPVSAPTTNGTGLLGTVWQVVEGGAGEGTPSISGAYVQLYYAGLMQNTLTDGTVSGAPFGFGTFDPNTQAGPGRINLDNGTGANQANRVWMSKARELAAATNEVLDVNKFSLIDIGANPGCDGLGVPLDLSAGVLLAITNHPESAGSITIGGAGTGAWTSPFGGSTSSTDVINPGGMRLWFEPGATGLPIGTSGSNHLLKVATTAGALYDIVVIGRQV